MKTAMDHLHPGERTMRQTAKKIFITALSLATIIGTAALVTVSPVSAQEDAPSSTIEKGKAVAYDRKKGNCLACHAMDDGALPGNIAPPLVSMKLRYPDMAKLRKQIWDATAANPNSIMPPFGRHKMLSEQEIDQITEYVYTL
ncbi:MAG: sulfur oxidation c-type cytochrome SoxX [Gammaproteobacteria bacterium]